MNKSLFGDLFFVLSYLQAETSTHEVKMSADTSETHLSVQPGLNTASTRLSARFYNNDSRERALTIRGSMSYRELLNISDKTFL